MKNQFRILLISLGLVMSPQLLDAQAPAKPVVPKRAASKPARAPGKPAASKQTTGKKAASKPAAEKKGGGKGEASKVDVQTRDASDSDIELPPGANEDDIRAIRGANAMRNTEKRFGEILKKMKIRGDAKYVRFDSIDTWPYEEGYKGMPKHIQKLDGKVVAMAGFMLPIDEVEDIKHFYLVKSLWSCCYGTPPDVNGLIKINVAAKKGCAYQYDPILIVGKFRLKKVMDEDYCVCIFQMDGAKVRVIDMK